MLHDLGDFDLEWLIEFGFGLWERELLYFFGCFFELELRQVVYFLVHWKILGLFLPLLLFGIEPIEHGHLLLAEHPDQLPAIGYFPVFGRDSQEFRVLYPIPLHIHAPKYT